MKEPIAAGMAAVCELRERAGIGRLKLSSKEKQWLDRIESELAALPGEDDLRVEMLDRCGELFAPGSYGWE